MGAVLSGGQRHESTFFVDLMEEVSVPRPRGRPRQRPEAAQGRSGLRCRLDPSLALRQRHRVGDPGPQRPPRGPWTPTNLRRPEVPRPKYGRALCWPSQGAAASRGPIRKEGEPLQGDDPLGICRRIPESIIIRRSLVQRVALRLIHVEARPRDRRCGFRRHELKGGRAGEGAGWYRRASTAP